jgi:hypothetical protein
MKTGNAKVKQETGHRERPFAERVSIEKKGDAQISRIKFSQYM